MSQFIEMFGENNTVSLCDVAHIIMGSSPDSEYYNENGEGLPFYQGKTEFGDMYIKPAVTFCTKPVREADVNDILMSVRAPVGAVNIAQEHCCIGRGLSAIRAKSEKMTPLFLYYALKIKEDDIAALGTGSTFKAINKDVVYSIQIPASTMDDQQKFVAIAQQADKSKFVGFKSQFIEMFERPEQSKSRLGDFVSIRTGKLDANAASKNGLYPFFTCGTETLSIDTYAFDCEAVLLAGNGEFCVKYYNGRFNAYQRTYVIESKYKTVLSVPFLFAWLQQYADKLKEIAIGGVIKYIKMGDLTEASIYIPSIEKQNQFVAIAQQADKSKYFS